MSDMIRPFIVLLGTLLTSILFLLFVRREGATLDTEEVFVVVFSLGKTIFFVAEMFRHIARTAHHEISQQKIFGMIGLYAFLFVVSFAFDAWILFEVDPLSIAGITHSEGAVHRLADMLYYSVSTFTTAGFGDLLPVSRTARLLASAELMLSFFLTVLVIANFSNLREHFKAKNANNKEGAGQR